MRVALGQMEVIAGKPQVNVDEMLRLILSAKAQNADLIAFPEMAVPGYFIGDAWEQQAFLRDCELQSQRLVNASGDIIVCFGSVAVDWNKRGEDGRVRKYNAFYVAHRGGLLGGESYPYPFRIKTLLPNYREFDDSRHFFSSRLLALELNVHIAQLMQPVCVHMGSGATISLGCLLCEDGWSDDYGFDPMAAIVANGRVDLFLNLSASPFTLGKSSKRHRLFGKHVSDVQIPLVYVNNVGMQNIGKTVYTFDGGSTHYACDGSIIHESRHFEPTLDLVDVDLTVDLSESDRTQAPPTLSQQTTVAVDAGPHAIYKALTYGIQKFTSAIGMKRAVIGISGGIDSAVAACLYCQVLGPKDILLVNMPSVYNSETTKSLSKRLATNLGCLYTVIPIQESVDGTVKQLAEAEVTNLATGEVMRLGLSSFMVENVQARDRSARILAAVASAFECGFTCNGNKSELTVGYATLYGDLSGFLAALGDLWKHQVYELAEYLNTEVYSSEVIPQGIIDIVPSAELSGEQAVDEGKGDPLVYPYHDYLFRAFVERWNRATPEDVLRWYRDGVLEDELGCAPGLVASQFSTHRAFIEDLERWWRQYQGMGIAKRIQSPPILAVSRRAFGFDHREAQNGVYFTTAYAELKAQLLSAGTQGVSGA